MSSTIKLYSDQKGSGNDLVKYLSDNLVKTDRLNDPTLLDFTLVPSDSTFETIRPKRGYYIRVETSTYGLWFTGYITNEPELTYIGQDPVSKLPVWGYKYEATADDYLLNLQPVGVLPNYQNMTMGVIIKDLVDRIAPNTFDAVNIQDGPIIADYAIDPTLKFGQIVADLAAKASYRFYSKDKKLYFQPQDYAVTGLSVDGNDTHFTPSRLNIQASKDPIINDAVVIGDVEPQEFVSEYFVGDGYTGNFQLLTDVFGADKAVLLDETFGNEINTDTWAVFDQPSPYLVSNNGFLNCLGGTADGTFSVYLEANNLVTLDGDVRITHGDWDFLNAGVDGVKGIIGGLWTPSTTPDNVISPTPNVLYGLGVQLFSGTTTLTPIVNTTWDTSQGQVTIDYTKRYVMKTLLHFNKTNRLKQAYSYLSSSGAVTSVGGTGENDTVILTTYITPIDPTTGTPGTTKIFSHTLSLTSSQLFAAYRPIVSRDLHATVTNITISTPLQAFLEVKKNGSSSFNAKILGVNEIATYDGLDPVATISQSGSVSSSSKNNRGSARYNSTNAALQFFKNTANQTLDTAGIGDLIRLKYRRGGISVGRINDRATVQSEASAWGDSGTRSTTYRDLTPSPRTSEECELAASAIVGGNKFQHYEGYYITYSMFCSGEPTSGTVLNFLNLPTVTFTAGSFKEVVTEVTSTILAADSQGEVFEHKIGFGPIDPIANVVKQFYEPDTKEKSTGVDVDIPAAIDASVLAYAYADPVVDPKLVSWDSSNFNFDANQLPPQKNLLKYSEDMTQSIWSKGGSGTGLAPVVSTITTVNPRGNSGSVSRVVFDKGTGTTLNDYSTLYYNDVALLPDVTYTYSVWLKSNSGASKIVRLYLGYNIDVPITVTTNWQRFKITRVAGDASTTPPSILLRGMWDTDNSADLLVWGAQLEVGAEMTYYVQNNASINTLGGFEVRYTDDSWGCDDGKNLIGRFTTQTFSVPRNSRGKVCCIKAYKVTNQLKYSEDMTQTAWTKSPSPFQTAVTQSMELGPNNELMSISNVTFNTNGVNTPYILQDCTYAVAGAKAVLSLWVNGPVGKSFTMELKDSTNALLISTGLVTMTGAWQKLTVSGTFPVTSTGSLRVILSQPASQATTTFKITRCNAEVGTLTETIYCKTGSSLYGVASRYAAMVRVNFPMVPPAPTASLDITNKAKPVVNVTLPSLLSDVWGVEIRASDDSSVLYKKSLADASYLPSYTYDNSGASRSLAFKVYTYNLLGEYSSVYDVSVTIPTPSITAINLDNNTAVFSWTATDATKFSVTIATDSGFTSLTFGTLTTEFVVNVSDSDFFPLRYFKVIPYDDLGAGTPVNMSHEYSAAAPVQVTTAEVGAIGPPASPTTDVTISNSNLNDYRQEIIERSWKNYRLNLDRAF